MAMRTVPTCPRQGRSRRERLVALGAATAAALALAACSTSPASSGGATSGGGSAAHVGGTLTIGIATNPATLNQDFTDNQDNSTIDALVFDSLVYLNSAEVPEPDLATSWSVSNGGDTYTFQLRHGVKWSDGKPFSSADVVYTLKDVLKYNPLEPATLLTDIKSVSANGLYTVVVNLKAPYAPFVTAMAQSFDILPAHIYAGTNPLTNPANDKPVGTGPYIFQSWQQNKEIVMVRNPHYWGKGPYFDKVVLGIIPNQATEIDGMLSGELDFLPDSELPTTNIKQLNSASCCRTVLVHDTPSIALLFTNTARPPFNNVKVRQAVYTALNRNYIVQTAFSGYATPAIGPIPATYGQLYDPSANFLTAYPYNQAKAASMLNAAGFPVKNGTRFTITFAYTDAIAGAASTAAIVKAELAKININVNLVDEDLNTWAARTYTARNFDLSYITYTSQNDPALGIARTYVCQPDRSVLYSNPTGFCNSQVDADFAAGATASTAAGRQADYAKATAILEQQLPVYPLAFRGAYVAVSKKIMNWQQALQGGGAFAVPWNNAWFG
jgi:peptide/nickel transport system substrate-binding protein